MTEMNDPFKEHGYDPELMGVAIGSLKRGRNGQGKPVILVDDNSVEIAVLTEDDKSLIAGLVDNAVGEESARWVGWGILAVIEDRFGAQSEPE